MKYRRNLLEQTFERISGVLNFDYWGGGIFVIGTTIGGWIWKLK